MSSKASILAAIRANKPGPRPLPTLPTDPDIQRGGGDGAQVETPLTETLAELETAFRTVLKGSKTTFIEPAELKSYVRDFGSDPVVVSTVADVPGNLPLASVTDPLQLAGVDLTILPARLGVAENGAMWVSETEMVHRVLPFITQHLILVVQRDALVATMHQAYRRVRIGATGFGVFIAGPSKTADIEQSLVIGAHGPRSLAVVLQ